MNSVKKRLADCTDHENEHLIDLYGEEALLGTIHIPKNLNVLSHRLPKPNYRRFPQSFFNFIGPKKSHQDYLTSLEIKVQTLT
jgi:hypothetical protein